MWWIIRCKGATFSGTEQSNPACLYEVEGCLYEDKKTRRVISTGRGLTFETWLAGMLLHDSGGVSANGGGQSGEDGDDDVNHTFDDLLCTVFHGIE